MSRKSVLKFVIAFGILAVLLVFLGVNYVPRIAALSSTSGNSVDAAKYAGSDYFERHPSVNSSDHSANQLADNPELLAVWRFETGSTNGSRKISSQLESYERLRYGLLAIDRADGKSPLENHERLRANLFATDQANGNAPIYKILGENPELILARR